MDNILKEYEDFMQTSKVYECLPIIYPILGLNGEAGEAAEKVKKCLRDNDGKFDEEIKNEIKKELADVLWYIWAAADDMNTSLGEIMSIGMQKVKERQETNTVHGSGDDRELMNKISALPKNESVIKNDILVLKINDCNETFYLNLRPEQKVTIELFNIVLQTNVKYNCIFKGFERIDGSLLLEIDDQSKLYEVTAKLNKIGIEYSCYICGIQYNNITYRIINYVKD